MRPLPDSSFTDFFFKVVGDGVLSGVFCWIFGSDSPSTFLRRVEGTVGGRGVGKNLLKSSLALALKAESSEGLYDCNQNPFNKSQLAATGGAGRKIQPMIK